MIVEFDEEPFGFLGKKHAGAGELVGRWRKFYENAIGWPG
jgi:hypothetical protein